MVKPYDDSLCPGHVSAGTLNAHSQKAAQQPYCRQSPRPVPKRERKKKGSEEERRGRKKGGEEERKRNVTSTQSNKGEVEWETKDQKGLRNLQLQRLRASSTMGNSPFAGGTSSGPSNWVSTTSSRAECSRMSNMGTTNGRDRYADTQVLILASMGISPPWPPPKSICPFFCPPNPDSKCSHRTTPQTKSHPNPPSSSTSKSPVSAHAYSQRTCTSYHSSTHKPQSRSHTPRTPHTPSHRQSP